MSFTYGGISTNDLQGVHVTPLAYPNLGGLTLDTVETPGRDGRFYGGSRLTTSVMSFRVTIRGENQMQADQRRLDFLRMLDPSIGPRSLRLDNTQAWHYPQAVVAEQIEWEKFADSHRVIYDGTVTFETNFDPAMRQIEPISESGSGVLDFVAEYGSTVSYPTAVLESGGNLRIKVNDFELDLRDTPEDTFAVLNWDEFKFYTAQPDLMRSILYQWAGTPHESPSIKVQGEEIARNYFKNPNFEGSEDYFEYTQYTQFAGIKQVSGAPSGSHVYSIQAREVASNHTFSRFLPVIEEALHNPKWLAISADVRLMQPNSGFQIRVQFHDGERTRYVSLQRVKNLGWQRVQFGVVALPAGASDVKFSLYINDGNSLTNAAPSNAEAQIDRLMVAVASSEQEALAQAEQYFDGDTVGHVVPGERTGSLVNHMSHFDRPSIYPGQRVEVEVTDLDSNQNTPVIIYPNYRRL